MYDNAYQLVQALSPAGLKGISQFDERGLIFKTYSGLLASESDLQQAMNSRSFNYDANGNLATAVDGRGYTRSTGYDAFDRAVKFTDARQPDPTTATATFDHAGNPVEVTVSGKKSASATGVLTQSRAGFDNFGRNYRTGRLAVKNDGTTALGYSADPSSSNDTPGWAIETFKFLADGRLLSSVRDYLDAATPALSTPDVVLGYDDLGRLVRQTDRGNNLATFAYDLAGNLITMNDYRFDQDSNQQTLLVRHTTYDEMGRVLSQYLDNDTPATSRWNAVGLIAHQFSTQSGTTRYSYDGGWRLSSTTRSGNGTWSVNSSTGAVSQTGSQSLTTIYRYDADDNLKQVVDNGGNQKLRLYDLLGRHVRTTFPDGTQFTISATSGIGNVVAGDAYVAPTGGYDAEGNVLSIFDEGGNHIVRTYDEEGQLSTVAVTPATVSATLVGEVSASYSYDGLGRVLTAVNQDRFAHTISRSHTWNSLSKLESSNVVEATANARVNHVDELGRVESFEEGGATTTYAYDVLDRIVSTTVVKNSQTLFAGAMNFVGRLRTASATATSDGIDIVHQRDGRGRVIKTEFRDRLSGEPTRSRSFEYCSACGTLLAEIDNWRVDPGNSGRVLGTRMYRDGLGRVTAFAHNATFPDSGINRFSDAQFGGDTRAEARQFDATDMPYRRSLFVGSGDFGDPSKGVVETPHTNAYGSVVSPLPPGQGSDFVPDSIGNVVIERETATGPNITDDQVFRYRYDHRGRLVDIERKSDAEIIEERRYDAIGVEGNRQLVDLEVANADFSTGATTHVWYSRSDVNLQGGGVKFDSTSEPGTANLLFPGDMHWEPGYDGPAEVRASYHDFLIDGSAAASRLCTLLFSGRGLGYKFKIEVDHTQFRIYDREFDSAVNYTLAATVNHTFPNGTTALGVRVDLGDGGFGDDITIKVFADGNQLVSLVRSIGSQRFAPTRIGFETKGDGARLYRYHGYLGATSTQGVIPVLQARPYEEFLRRALCALNVPQGSQNVLTAAQQARDQLGQLQTQIAEAAGAFALARGLDESQFRTLASTTGSGCESPEDAFTRSFVQALVRLAIEVQDAINRVDAAEFEYKNAAHEVQCIVDLDDNYIAPTANAGGGFTLTNTYYTGCDNKGRGINPIYVPFQIGGTGQPVVLGVQQGATCTYWVQFEGGGTYTYSGSMECNVDTVAGYWWTVQPGPPDFALLTTSSAISQAQQRYERALRNLQNVLDDVAKSTPAWKAKSGEYHSFAMFLIEVLEDPNIQAVIQYANATHKSWLAQGKDYALNQLKSLPPIHMLLTGIDRYNHFRDQGMNPLFALVSANAWNIFEMTGAKGVYEGFTEEDAWTGETLTESEAHWRGFIGGMTLVLTASGVAEVFIPARGATVVLGLGTRVEANAASKLPTAMKSPQTVLTEVPKAPYFKAAEFKGRAVYFKESSFELGVPSKLDKRFIDKAVQKRLEEGATNLQLMQEGYAPIGTDGRPINLHHLLGEEPGPMAELLGTFHQKYKKPLHGLIQPGNSFRNDGGKLYQYEKFRGQYWKWRAEQCAPVGN